MKLFLFDLDGTLVTTGGAGVRALDRAFLSLTRVARACDGADFAGRTDPLIIKEIFRRRLGRDPHPVEFANIVEHYLSALETELLDTSGYKLMAGVAEILDALAGRERHAFLALGTGNFERGARLKLTPGGLNKYFSTGGYGSDAEDRPEVLRRGVQRAAEKAGRAFSGKEVVVIGDTVHDVSAGKAIGAFTVAVADGSQSPEALKASGPDIFIPSLRDSSILIDLLE